MTVKKKTKDELIDDMMLNNIIRFLKVEDNENALHYMYALKMWRKEDPTYATQTK